MSLGSSQLFSQGSMYKYFVKNGITPKNLFTKSLSKYFFNKKLLEETIEKEPDLTKRFEVYQKVLHFSLKKLDLSLLKSLLNQLLKEVEKSPVAIPFKGAFLFNLKKIIYMGIDLELSKKVIDFLVLSNQQKTLLQIKKTTAFANEDVKKYLKEKLNKDNTE
ncbi:MAG: hypothetical protein ACK4J0_02120 [Candidatus Anstonellaceae archaeon]